MDDWANFTVLIPIFEDCITETPNPNPRERSPTLNLTHYCTTVPLHVLIRSRNMALVIVGPKVRLRVGGSPMTEPETPTAIPEPCNLHPF